MTIIASRDDHAPGWHIPDGHEFPPEHPRLWCRADVFALAERDNAWQQITLGAERRAYERGRRDGWQRGFRRGYAAAEADQRRSWRAIVSALAHPERWAAQRLRAAAAAAARDAADHERAFVARAYATPPHQRTDAQAAAVHAYPPPGQRAA